MDLIYRMRNVALENQLCSAIQKHRTVHLHYKKQIYSRTFEPYVVYRSTKDNILVAGRQTKDDSQPLKKPEWHNFEVELISALEITDNTFKFDELFDPTNKAYRQGTICIIKRFKVSE